MSIEQHRAAAEINAIGMPSSTVTTWYLPVVSSRRAGYADAVLGAEAWLRAYRQLWDPMCAVSFVTSMARGRPAAGFAVACPSSARARSQARELAAALTATQPWLGLAEPTRRRPWPAPKGVAAVFEPRSGSDARGISDKAMPWLAAREGGIWHLVVELGPGSAPGAAVGGRAAAEDRQDPEPPSCLASVRLHGPEHGRAAVVSLLCCDDAVSAGLADAAQPRTADYPLGLLAHLLAAPARLPGVYPEFPPTPRGEFVRILSGLPSEHRLLVGQSGQGKSTAAVALAADAAGRGRTLVAVDVHDGDTVRRLAGQLERLGRPYLFLDWSDPLGGPCPVVRVADAPGGVSPAQHAEDLYTMLRHDVWGQMPAEYFGPVGELATRAGCELAALDPEHRFGLGDMQRLLDPAELQYRRATLRRIGTPRLSRAVERQLMPMAGSTDDNGAAFVLGKFAPFAAPVARKVFEGDTLRVPVEDAVARGWSLLLHAPSSGLGEDPSRLVVAAVLRRVWGAVRRIPHAPAVSVVLDEWQKYATGFTTTLLAEGRKFGVSVCAANQNLAQLQAEIRESVLSNVGAVVAYRVGPTDAAVLDGLYPTMPVRVLQTLPRHTAAVTTFDRGLVLQGPDPLPAPTTPPQPLEEALRAFWGGQEPPLRTPSDRGDHEPDDSDGTDDTASPFLQDFLRTRGAAARRP